MKERTYTRLMMSMAIVATVVGLASIKASAAEIEVGNATVRVDMVSESPSECVDSVYESLDRYPEELILSFYEDGGRMVLDPTGAATHGHAGLYKQYMFDNDGNLIEFTVGEMKNGAPTGDSWTIYPSEQNTVNIHTDTLKHTKMAQSHELGHWFDLWLSRNGRVYQSSDGAVFYEIWLEEHERSGYPNYNNWCTAEYFAESFSRLYQDPASLDNLPRTKAYLIEALADNFGSVYKEPLPVAEPEPVEEVTEEAGLPYFTDADEGVLEHWVWRRVYLSERDVIGGYYPPYYAEIRIS